MWFIPVVCSIRPQRLYQSIKPWVTPRNASIAAMSHQFLGWSTRICFFGHNTNLKKFIFAQMPGLAKDSLSFCVYFKMEYIYDAFFVENTDKIRYRNICLYVFSYPRKIPVSTSLFGMNCVDWKIFFKLHHLENKAWLSLPLPVVSISLKVNIYLISRTAYLVSYSASLLNYRWFLFFPVIVPMIVHY